METIVADSGFRSYPVLARNSYFLSLRPLAVFEVPRSG